MGHRLQDRDRQRYKRECGLRSPINTDINIDLPLTLALLISTVFLLSSQQPTYRRTFPDTVADGGGLQNLDLVGVCLALVSSSLFTTRLLLHSPLFCFPQCFCFSIPDLFHMLCQEKFVHPFFRSRKVFGKKSMAVRGGIRHLSSRGAGGSRRSEGLSAVCRDVERPKWNNGLQIFVL